MKRTILQRLIAGIFTGMLLVSVPAYADVDAQKLQELIQKAEQGDAGAQYNLGGEYYSGKNIQQDYTKAAYWYQKAAEQGDAVAQTILGAMYGGGEGVQQDYGKAAYWYQKAAKQGFTGAQFNLGVMYHYGKGVQQNYKKAVYWYQKAAKQGNERAQKASQLLDGY